MVDPLNCLIPAIDPLIGHGMCYPVCGMVHIKDPMLLNGKSNPCSGRSRLFLSRYLSGILPHVRRNITINKMC